MDISNRNPQSSELFVPGFGFIVGFGLFCVVGAVFITWLVTAGGVKVMPDEVSVQSQNTDRLFYVLVLLGSFVFFLVQGLLLYSVIRFRARANDTADGPNVHGNATLEIVWTVIPSVVVAGLAIVSVSIWDTNNNAVANENLINGNFVATHVTAQRFAWTFEYFTGEKDANGADIVLKPANLHTYEGQSLRLEMNSIDVIHAFWIPVMRIKQDVMPGRTTELRFSVADRENIAYDYILLVGPTAVYADQAVTGEALLTIKENNTLEVKRLQNDEAGLWVQVELVDGKTGWVEAAAVRGQMNRYRIVCAELCGGGHGQMFTYVFVHDTEESFLAWYDTNLELQRNPPDDPVELGRQRLVGGGYPCANCHALNSLGWQGITGPNLNGIGDRAGSRAAAAGDASGAAYLVHSLRASQDYLVPGAWSAQMPVFSPDPTVDNHMSDDDLIGIVAYLCTQVESGNPQDNTCGLEFNDDGTLMDVTATRDTLTTLAEEYSQP